MDIVVIQHVVVHVNHVQFQEVKEYVLLMQKVLTQNQNVVLEHTLVQVHVKNKDDLEPVTEKVLLVKTKIGNMLMLQHIKYVHQEVK